MVTAVKKIEFLMKTKRYARMFTLDNDSLWLIFKRKKIGLDMKIRVAMVLLTVI